MIQDLQRDLNEISEVLAITRYDIEQRQSYNDLSLNIHGEKYFLEIFEFVYKTKLINTNFESKNSPCIDLIDKKNKIAYQITTNRTKEKIEKTYKALKIKKYKDFNIRIFYLLDKANPKDSTKKYFKYKYGIQIQDHLFDYNDLLNDIQRLLTAEEIHELNRRYFSHYANKYTEVITINLIINHLIVNFKNVNPNYDDDFGNIETNNKLKLNNINDRISSKINDGLDYVRIVNDINEHEDILADLKAIIVDKMYKSILIQQLKAKTVKSKYENKTIEELHLLSKQLKLDFNKIINDLHKRIECELEINDFNSTSVSWIIISFFFEICHIGLKNDCPK